MWNIITSNRLLDKKRKQEAQRKHLAALKNIKPSIDNYQPNNYNFLYSRPKAKMIRLERELDIEHSNNILVEKMISISTIHKPKQTFFKNSLNYSFNKKIQRQIDLENGALVKRLRSASSQYGQRKFEKFSQEYSRAKTNLNRSRANTTVYELQMPSRNLSMSKRQFDVKSRPFSAKV